MKSMTCEPFQALQQVQGIPAQTERQSIHFVYKSGVAEPGMHRWSAFAGGFQGPDPAWAHGRAQRRRAREWL